MLFSTLLRNMSSFRTLNSRMFLKRSPRIPACTVQPIAICPFTDRIFIPNNSISVLSPSGKYLYSIKDPSILCSIQGICFIGEILCVTDNYNNVIDFMTTDGDVVTRAGRDTPGVLLDSPTAIASYSDRELFICDNNYKGVIQLFPDLPFSKVIGRGLLSKPVHIEVYDDGIFVLDSLSPCIANFCLDGILISRIFPYLKYDDIYRPLCFTIDEDGNFIFSDTRYSFRIFSATGQLLKAREGREKTITGPIGVAINSLSQIVCVCRGKQNNIQIF